MCVFGVGAERGRGGESKEGGWRRGRKEKRELALLLSFLRLPSLSPLDSLSGRSWTEEA